MRDSLPAAASALLLCVLLLAPSGASSRGRQRPDPPAPAPERLVHPDVRSTPTVTGSPTSFRAVSDLREISRRLAVRKPCRSCPPRAEISSVLADVERLIDLLLQNDCNPETVAAGAARTAGRLEDLREGRPSTRGRRARIQRDLAELQRRVTDVSRELLLASLGFLTRSAPARDRILPAREAMIEADARYEAGDLVAAAQGYADAFQFLAFDCVLDVEAFEAALAAEGSKVSFGWAYAIGQFGGLVASGAGGQARLPQNPPAKAMTPQTKVNTASTAKMLTTVAALRLLTAQGIGLDDPIGPYLPAPWPTNPFFDLITFRELLTHQSGIGGDNQRMADGWEQLKEIAVGFVSPLKKQQYENVNMGLFRALIPEILGLASETAANPGLAAGTNYANWVNDTLLVPSGVATALCDDPESPQTGYYPSFLAPGAGWFPGDLRYFCGGGGWYLSAEDWIGVLGNVRYGGILSGAEKAVLYGTPLGWWPRMKSYGVVYLHNGALISPLGGTRNCIGDFPSGWQVAFHLNTDVVTFDNTGVGIYDACNAVVAAFESAWIPVPK